MNNILCLVTNGPLFFPIFEFPDVVRLHAKRDR